METIVRSIGNEKQLFVDNWIVSDAWTAHRKIHQPAKHPANPLITGDNEWEKDRVFVYGAVAPRPGGGYRMWYQPVLDDTGRKGTGQSMQHYRICYAESDDGIEWTKPNLGLHDWTSWPSPASLSPTGRRSGPTTPWSASTRRYGVAPMSWASSLTDQPCVAWLAPSSLNSTTNGPSAVYTRHPRSTASTKLYPRRI